MLQRIERHRAQRAAGARRRARRPPTPTRRARRRAATGGPGRAGPRRRSLPTAAGVQLGRSCRSKRTRSRGPAVHRRPRSRAMAASAPMPVEGGTQDVAGRVVAHLRDRGLTGCVSTARRCDRPRLHPTRLSIMVSAQALVAQGIEHRFPKPCVAGSNPAGGAVGTARRNPRQWWSPWRPRVSTGVAPGRVHCGTGRLVGPQVATPSASERQYQQIGAPCPPTGEPA